MILGMRFAVVVESATSKSGPFKNRLYPQPGLPRIEKCRTMQLPKKAGTF